MMIIEITRSKSGLNGNSKYYNILNVLVFGHHHYISETCLLALCARCYLVICGYVTFINMFVNCLCPDGVSHMTGDMSVVLFLL